MGILDDVMVNVKSAAEVVGKKAGQIVDITKLKMNVSDLNSEINKRYMELGQKVYNSKKSGECCEADISEKVTEIDDLILQMNAIVQEIGTLQNKITCPVCGNQCSADASFCVNCGAKLKADPENVKKEECSCSSEETCQDKRDGEDEQ